MIYDIWNMMHDIWFMIHVCVPCVVCWVSILKHFGAMLGHLVSHLSVAWNILGQWWAILTPTWSHLKVFGRHVRTSWIQGNAFWAMTWEWKLMRASSFWCLSTYSNNESYVELSWLQLDAILKVFGRHVSASLIQGAFWARTWRRELVRASSLWCLTTHSNNENLCDGCIQMVDNTTHTQTQVSTSKHIKDTQGSRPRAKISEHIRAGRRQMVQPTNTR